MYRREFLDLLRYYLRSYPANIINDIIADYEEHFRIGMENGKSETEISAELGSPKDIADEFLAHDIPPRPQMNSNYGGSVPPQMGTAPNPMPSRQTSPLLIILMIIGGIFVFPPLIGVTLALFGAFTGVMLALLATILALGLSGVASILSWVLPIGRYITFFGYNLHPVTSVFLGIFLICLSILIGYLTFLLLGACMRGIKNLYLSIRWKMAKRRGQ
ncbi:DUF1700 domain-containing protein [Clostridiales bacterium COT073_COT-073]|nr:DUF1700 domain-containing protein [Clostridiales bacterium COT073_COT-073]